MCRKKEKIIGSRITHYGVEVVKNPVKIGCRRQPPEGIVKPKPFLTDVQYDNLLLSNKNRYDNLTPDEKTELIKNKRLHQIKRCQETGQLH